MAHRVAPGGCVVATDIDIRNLDPGGGPNLEAKCHDIVLDDLPAAAFDLVHARLLLKHLPDRERALANMVASLRPGGWLVAEDTDWANVGIEPHQPAFAEALAALRALSESTGGVLDYGRALPQALAATGLVEVGSSCVAHRLRGGTPDIEVLRLTFEQVRQRAVGGGLIASPRLDAALAALDAPGSTATAPTMVTAWGRKPR